ncbi:interleukin-17A/F-2 isoform X1 [Oryzias latipes]|uniref:Interleukin 17a/f2 n=2 Tax=Oryzias latipes TaxID=8090 RepID=A0A3B3IPI4_ORYLA|nr:interleukin-17A/F-2 isoform X1 [Oryzias latipes]
MGSNVIKRVQTLSDHRAALILLNTGDLGDVSSVAGTDPSDRMELPTHSICILMVICCSLRFSSCSDEGVLHPPDCNVTLQFSSEIFSLSRGNGNIHQRSMSPWRWRSTTVRHRIPSTLWEAECDSIFCSNPTSGQPKDYSLNSVPIYQNILVLNHVKGSHCYTASYHLVAVGCTCVWARSNQT